MGNKNQTLSLYETKLRFSTIAAGAFDEDERRLWIFCLRSLTNPTFKKMNVLDSDRLDAKQEAKKTVGLISVWRQWRQSCFFSLEKRSATRKVRHQWAEKFLLSPDHLSSEGNSLLLHNLITDGEWKGLRPSLMPISPGSCVMFFPLINRTRIHPDLSEEQHHQIQTWFINWLWFQTSSG